MWTYNSVVKWALITFIEIEVLLKTMSPSSKDYSYSPYLYYAIANILGAISLILYVELGDYAWNPIAGCMLGSTDESQ